MQWVAQTLSNQMLLVCNRCWDVPSPFLRTLVLPPDPTPIIDARTEPFEIDETDWRVTEDDNRRITQNDQPRIIETGDYPDQTDQE
jgi:hypothetical protein